ncbi:MAG: LlaJI family restriction endonuclease, partial [Firmicutes bacterium]|nr:LlaJI family restriction endonuclease [Bacillota bacterium]
MISAFLREQKRYTLEELSSIMSCSEETSVSILRILKEYGILKAVKANDRQKDMSDLFDEDIAVADVDPGRSDLYYVLTFVGVIAVAGRVLKCYPKYLLTNESPVRELGQILKVLERYNSKEQIIKLFNDSDNSRSFNLLAVLLFLLTDYYENGSYSNTEDVIESNGPGVILWDKTINETFALLNNNRPFYIDLQTKRRVFNDYDYFKRLHECVLTRASKELYEANLLDLFEITEVNLSDELLEDFGDKDYILYRIEKELSIQFNTRKQLVLKTLYAYIDQNSSLQDIDCLSLFGTNSFNLVWESVCAEILNNQLNTCLGDLSLPVPLRPQYSKSIKLMDLIEKPFWSAAERYAMSTLIPDIVTIVQNK